MSQSLMVCAVADRCQELRDAGMCLQAQVLSCFEMNLVAMDEVCCKCRVFLLWLVFFLSLYVVLR